MATCIWVFFWLIQDHPGFDFSDPNSWAIWLLICIALDLFFS